MYEKFFPSVECDAIANGVDVFARNKCILAHLNWPQASAYEDGVIAVAVEHLSDEDLTVVRDKTAEIVTFLKAAFATEERHHYRQSDGHDIRPKAMIHIRGIDTLEEGFDLDEFTPLDSTEDGYFIRGADGAGVFVGLPYVDECFSPLDPAQPETVELRIIVWHATISLRA